MKGWEAKKALAYAEDIILALREPFLVLNNELRVKRANKSFYDTFRVDEKNTEGRLVYELGNGQWDIPRLRELLASISANVRDFEVTHDFPVIGRKVMLVNANRFPRESQHHELILLAIEDVTERRRAEAALRESEIRYRRLFEAARDGILILDVDTGKIIDANPYITEILGYSHGELLGKELWEIGLFGDIEASRDAFRQLQDHGYISCHHLPLQNKSGEGRVEVEFVSNSYSVDGKTVIQCNIRDITERTLLEREQVQATATADLHHRKDEFLAMLSHELRNPLAPILNAVQLLELDQASETSRQKKARTVIGRQGSQMRVIVDDLLEVSRITTGRIQLHKEQINVKDVIERAVESVAPLIAHNGHELTVSQPMEPVLLYADPTRLEQVLVNLLTNAIKYTKPRGHINVNVWQKNNDVILSVADDGIGIAAEMLPRIFDSFMQVSPPLDRPNGGLGIGLTVVKKLVGLHGGTVGVKSKLGKGSEFTVRLPIMHPTTSSPQAGAAPGEGRALRVLVVDDIVDTADTTALLVQAAGHEARMVHDGPDALRAALDFKPDVILLDIGLPNLDGYEVARRIRAMPELKNVGLVAVTGYGQTADRQRSLSSGFDHHLLKPVDFAKVQKVLMSVAEAK